MKVIINKLVDKKLPSCIDSLPRKEGIWSVFVHFLGGEEAAVDVFRYSPDFQIF